MINAQLIDIRIYPVKDEPGQRLESIAIGPEGLDGDRRKKAAVHLVSLQDSEGEHEMRANLFVSATPDELSGAVGHDLQVGGAVLSVESVPSGCPGVYASVVKPGMVHTGDQVTSAPPAPHDG
jgi:MOSC domain-containing protein YiiM